MAFDYGSINSGRANLQGINSTFAARMAAAVQAAYQATGQWAQISTPMSGYRSTADQARQYAAYQAGGGIAARPGQSLHEQGMAFDFKAGPARDWIQAHAADYGLEAGTVKDRAYVAAHPGANWSKGQDPVHIQLARGVPTTQYDRTPYTGLTAPLARAGFPVPPANIPNPAAPGAPPQRTMAYTPGQRMPTGPDVASLQQQLLSAGYNLGKTGPRGNGVDGKYGPMTSAAVRAFQRDNQHLYPNLSIDRGIAGPQVQNALAMRSALAGVPGAPDPFGSLPTPSVSPANYGFGNIPGAPGGPAPAAAPAAAVTGGAMGPASPVYSGFTPVGLRSNATPFAGASPQAMLGGNVTADLTASGGPATPSAPIPGAPGGVPVAAIPAATPATTGFQYAPNQPLNRAQQAQQYADRTGQTITDRGLDYVPTPAAALPVAAPGGPVLPGAAAVANTATPPSPMGWPGAGQQYINTAWGPQPITDMTEINPATRQPIIQPSQPVPALGAPGGPPPAAPAVPALGAPNPTPDVTPSMAPPGTFRSVNPDGTITAAVPGPQSPFAGAQAASGLQTYTGPTGLRSLSRSNIGPNLRQAADVFGLTSAGQAVGDAVGWARRQLGLDPALATAAPGGPPSGALYASSSPMSPIPPDLSQYATRPQLPAMPPNLSPEMQAEWQRIFAPPLSPSEGMPQASSLLRDFGQAVGPLPIGPSPTAYAGRVFPPASRNFEDRTGMYPASGFMGSEFNPDWASGNPGAGGAIGNGDLFRLSSAPQTPTSMLTNMIGNGGMGPSFSIPQARPQVTQALNASIGAALAPGGPGYSVMSQAPASQPSVTPSWGMGLGSGWNNAGTGGGIGGGGGYSGTNGNQSGSNAQGFANYFGMPYSAYQDAMAQAQQQQAQQSGYGYSGGYY